MIDPRFSRTNGKQLAAWAVAALALFAGAAGNAAACSMCDPNFQSKPTLRQSVRTASFVVLGTLSNPRLVGENGFTDLLVEQIVVGDKVLGRQKVLTLPGYTPFDPKKPPRYLLFGDIVDGRISISRGAPIAGAGIADYLRASLQIDERDRAKVTQFCYQHLDSADPDVSGDAFLEFARASDQEVAALAGKLSPKKFRKLLRDPAYPERHGICAYLLGACGTKNDAVLLTSMIQASDVRGNPALSGLLGGLIELRPQEGWAATVQILADPKRHFSDRLAALSTLRFYRACKGDKFRKEILLGLSAVVQQGDMADMAMEDLRRWQWWDMTRLVLEQYGKPTHAAPLVKRAIVRYALCCSDQSAGEFVNARRRAEPDLVAGVERSLEFERASSTSKK